MREFIARLRKWLLRWLLRLVSHLLGLIDLPIVQVIMLLPGDSVIVRVNTQLSPTQITSFRDAWRARFGDAFPVAILDTRSDLSVLRLVHGPEQCAGCPKRLDHKRDRCKDT